MIEKGLVTTPEELKTTYKKLLKRWHPDLNRSLRSRVDLDDLKKAYLEAAQYLEKRLVETQGTAAAIRSRKAFLEEFRELVARGFPINHKAATRNKAYARSAELVAAYLGQVFRSPVFFDLADRQLRDLRRHFPKIHWYWMQTIWNIFDFQATGFDTYQRVARRHLSFIADFLEQNGFGIVLSLSKYLVEDFADAG